MTARRIAVSLPAGTVTFLFTDIQGSTRLLRSLGNGYERLLQDHHRILREAIEGAGGVEADTEGDGFFAVFESAAAAVSAAADAQRNLAAHPWPNETPVRVRMGMHSGEGIVGADGYIGLDVHKAARIGAAAHGGQVILSAVTRTLAETALPEGVTLKDLGAHRLKDFDAREHLYQLVIGGLPDEFPPPRTLEIPENLPASLTSFVGREKELTQVGELLRKTRLLTLTGPGGTGKTRLALQAARQAIEGFPDGVFFVDLAPIIDPTLVVPSVAKTVGVREEAERSITDTIVDELRDKELLLVLDNFEQVIRAAPEVTRLLTAAAKVRVLATSRCPLSVWGEREFPVPPMSLPRGDEEDLSRLGRSEAVALFIDRAAAIDSGFTLSEENAPAVAEICSRLDGLPLAIELAASRIRLLSPQAILARLDQRLPLLAGGPLDLPARQQTLRGAIGWSHDLLEENERALFRRLGTFAGSWSLEAAEAVANPDENLGSTLDLLNSLVASSLIGREDAGDGEFRLRMLQTIREYAAERLEESGEAVEVRARHAAFFAALCEEAEPELAGPEQGSWLDRLERDQENLRAALGWALGEGRPEGGLGIAGAAWRFWQLRGHLTEGRDWLIRLLAIPSPDRALRGRALMGLGGLAYWQNDADGARAAYEEGLAIYRELDDRPGIAEALYNLSFVDVMVRDLAMAKARIEEARPLYEELQDRAGVAKTAMALSLVGRIERDWPSSLGHARQALELFREVGDRFHVLTCLRLFGRAAYELGDHEAATEAFGGSLHLAEDLGDHAALAVTLEHLAAIANGTGRPGRAVRLAGSAAAMKETFEVAVPPSLVDLPDPLEEARRHLAEEVVATEWDAGRAMGLEEALAYAASDREEGGWS